MEAIHARAKFEDGTSAANVRINGLSISDAQELFRSGFSALLDETDAKAVACGNPMKNHRRVGEIKCSTIYNDMKVLKIDRVPST